MLMSTFSDFDEQKEEWRILFIPFATFTKILMRTRHMWKREPGRHKNRLSEDRTVKGWKEFNN